LNSSDVARISMWVAGAGLLLEGGALLLLDRPFGLQLGPGENVFHWIVGPLALCLGVWSMRRQSALSNQ
jgi:hypothetical protein